MKRIKSHLVGQNLTIKIENLDVLIGRAFGSLERVGTDFLMEGDYTVNMGKFLPTFSF